MAPSGPIAASGLPAGAGAGAAAGAVSAALSVLGGSLAGLPQAARQSERVRAGHRRVIACLRMLRGLEPRRGCAVSRPDTRAIREVTRAGAGPLFSGRAVTRGLCSAAMQAPAPEPLRCLADVVADPERLYVGHACVRGLQHGRTRQGRPFVDLTLADASRVVAGKIWDDAPEAMEAARTLARGSVVKLMFRAEVYQGTIQ